MDDCSHSDDGDRPILLSDSHSDDDDSLRLLSGSHSDDDDSPRHLHTDSPLMDNTDDHSPCADFEDEQSEMEPTSSEYLHLRGSDSISSHTYIHR